MSVAKQMEMYEKAASGRSKEERSKMVPLRSLAIRKMPRPQNVKPRIDPRIEDPIAWFMSKPEGVETEFCETTWQWVPAPPSPPSTPQPMRVATLTEWFKRRGDDSDEDA